MSSAQRGNRIAKSVVACGARRRSLGQRKAQLEPEGRPDGRPARRCDGVGGHVAERRLRLAQPLGVLDDEARRDAGQARVRRRHRGPLPSARASRQPRQRSSAEPTFGGLRLGEQNSEISTSSAVTVALPTHLTHAYVMAGSLATSSAADATRRPSECRGSDARPRPAAPALRPRESVQRTRPKFCRFERLKFDMHTHTHTHARTRALIPGHALAQLVARPRAASPMVRTLRWQMKPHPRLSPGHAAVDERWRTYIVRKQNVDATHEAFLGGRGRAAELELMILLVIRAAVRAHSLILGSRERRRLARDPAVHCRDTHARSVSRRPRAAEAQAGASDSCGGSFRRTDLPIEASGAAALAQLPALAQLELERGARFELGRDGSSRRARHRLRSALLHLAGQRWGHRGRSDPREESSLERGERGAVNFSFFLPKRPSHLSFFRVRRGSSGALVTST